jgi:hypothetical protein
MKPNADAKTTEPETAGPKGGTPPIIPPDTTTIVAARMDILIAGLLSATPSRVVSIHDSLVIEMKKLRSLGGF